MRRSHAALAVAAVLYASPALAQPLTIGQVSEALALAEKGKVCECRIDGMGSDYAVSLIGPYGFIGRIVTEMRAKLQSVSAETVMGNEQAIAPVLRVIVRPFPPELVSRKWSVADPVTAVALRAKGSDDLIRPAKAELFPVAWSNAFGAKFSSGGASVEFDMATLPPAGEVDVVVATSGGEQLRFTIKDKHRRQLVCR